MRFHDVWEGNTIAQEREAASPGVTGLRRHQKERQIIRLRLLLMF
jgi:hypothetical protein